MGHFGVRRLLFIGRICNGFAAATLGASLFAVSALETDAWLFANLTKPEGARRGSRARERGHAAVRWLKPKARRAQVAFTEWSEKGWGRVTGASWTCRGIDDASGGR